MSIVILKLSTGEELLGKREESVYAGFKIQKPRVLQMMQTREGVSAGLMPFIMAAPDETVLIADRHVITHLDAPSDIEKAYLQQTSGIQIAQSLMG